MFKIKANPTIPARITIVGQGREQQLNVVFRHKTQDERDALAQQVADGKVDTAGLLVDLIESWDADMEVSAGAIAALQQHQPGAAEAILSAYGQAIRVERAKN